MADYTSEDLKRATEIVENLRSSSARGDRDGPFNPDLIKDGFSVADVQAHAEQFYGDLEILGELGLPYPAVRLDGEALVPVALSETQPELKGMMPGSPEFWRHFVPRDYLRELLYDNLRKGMKRFGEQLAWLEPTEADASFRSRASEFLASRFAGSRSFAGGAPPPDGPPPTKFSMQKFLGGPLTKVSGCLFSVHTQSPNLSVYWSGAYLICSNYHGAPTTPAIGPLQAGTYVFGVNGGAYGNVVQWDLNKVCTLPGRPNVRLQY